MALEVFFFYKIKLHPITHIAKGLTIRKRIALVAVYSITGYWFNRFITVLARTRNNFFKIFERQVKRYFSILSALLISLIHTRWITSAALRALAIMFAGTAPATLPTSKTCS